MAYEMRISDWSSVLCSSELAVGHSHMPRERCRVRAPRPIPGQSAVIGKWRTGFDIIVDSDDVVDGAPRIVIAGVELCRVARVDGLQLVTIAAIEALDARYIISLRQTCAELVIAAGTIKLDLHRYRDRSAVDRKSTRLNSRH